MKRWMRLPSPAMVVALASLVMSVGGTVTAAALITSADIKDNTIRSVDIRDETIKSRDVDNGTLTGVDVKDGTIKGVDVANGALTGVDVKNNSLTGADLNESTLAEVPSAASATNAQDAGEVDGFDANSLIRVAHTGTNSVLALTTSFQTYGPTLSIIAPAAGFVMVQGSTTVGTGLTECTWGCAFAGLVRHVQSGVTSQYTQDSVGTGQRDANMSHVSVFPVNPGLNTFQMRLVRNTGDGNLRAQTMELTAIYSPFGPAG
jgi:hypothetical protein